MRSFLISDNRDTWIGMGLAGIEGVVVRDRESALKEIKKAESNQDIGILIVTERITDMIKDEYMEYKSKSRTPLLIEIPDRHGSVRKGNAIKDYIRDSVGIHIWGD